MKRMGNQYITDVIGEEYKTWSHEEPVLIHAPMGTGKTYFCLNVLLPYVHSQGKKLVYVANRTALKQQVENDIPLEYRDSIITCSYQRFANINLYHQRVETSHQKKDVEIASGDYYVLDEAHYFLADSGFNLNIEKSFSLMQTLKRNNSTSVWIYMTATLSYLLLQLNFSESLGVSKTLNIPYLGQNMEGSATYDGDGYHFPYIVI